MINKVTPSLAQLSFKSKIIPVRQSNVAFNGIDYVRHIQNINTKLASFDTVKFVEQIKFLINNNSKKFSGINGTVNGLNDTLNIFFRKIWDVIKPINTRKL